MDDRQQILDLLTERTRAIGAGDAAAAATAPGAVTFNLQPPLGYRHDHAAAIDALNAWFGTWDGPIELHFEAAEVRVSGDLAVASGFTRLRGTSRSSGAHESWFRTTVALERQARGWVIVHEHASYPTRMDGSGLSAADLEPEL